MSEIHYGFGTPVAETGVPAAVADGADVSIWFNEYGQQTFRGFNLGTGSLDVSEVAPAKLMTFYHAFTQLTAAGNTASVDLEDYDLLTIQIVVANIDTSVDVIAQGSLDNTNFYNLDDTGAVTQYVANDTYQMHCDNRKNRYFRFRFDAEVGGTNVTLDVDIFAGN